VRRLGLLLAVGLVVQAPGLAGIGVSGARAAAPTPSYQATLVSIDSNCVATVTATWSNAKVQSVQFYVRDLTTGAIDPPSGTAPTEPVSGKSGTLSYTFQLNPLLTGAVTPHSFDAIVWFYSAQNPPKQIYTNSLDAPCYWGQLV
jgi:hypothetical protein